MTKDMNRLWLIIAYDDQRSAFVFFQILKEYFAPTRHTLQGRHSPWFLASSDRPNLDFGRAHRKSMIRIRSRDRRRALNDVQPRHLFGGVRTQADSLRYIATFRRIVARVTQRPRHGRKKI